ncbi:MAG: nicotinate-nucleotide adenylyltransferase [Chloroflexi bacterium]|nr:nicotinate-nucleotide adenylyltransferase [Chloroflexota bacterium]MCC6896355.1 nicotinate-nucleotide adenylyltransferase [Anaerolineae bacterium]
MERIGILGGTFDPPHVGHLILAQHAVGAIGLERLLFMPAADPPHKQQDAKTAVEHRIRMLDCATQDNPQFMISRIDVDRPGPHYSVDMMRLVQDEYPQAELYFIMGGDSLQNLPTWYQPRELLKLCRIAVMRRPQSEIPADLHAAVLPELADRLTIVDAPLIDISSTAIVSRFQAGLSIRYLVPDAVLDYINTNQLYR